MKGVMIASVLLLSTAAGAAQAACVQSDVTGKWRLFPTFVASGSLDWFRCTLGLDSAGNVTSKSFCLTSSDPPLKLTADSGTLTVTGKCAVSGFFTALAQNVTIVDGQLSKDKQTMAGVGTGPLGHFSFTAVKQ